MFQTKVSRLFLKVTALLVIFSMVVTSNLLFLGERAYAQVINLGSSGLTLPSPGSLVSLSAGFQPVVLKGIKVYPQNPFHFDFIVDTGDSKLKEDQLKQESTRLIKYFLASLTVPEDQMWVNLSPYEKERIIPESFGVTEMGRDMLLQDYLLKQLTASLIYPEHDLGKAFWEKIYQKAYEQYGTTNIPVNTFNKVWILPERAVVYEHEGMAFVGESRLKVMLDHDYQALRSQLLKDQGATDPSLKAKEVNDLSGSIVKDLIVPAIEKEVNEGENFANLRQIYHSLILAAWYKRTLKESLLGQQYVDQNKVKGIDLEDKEIKQKIYEQYLKVFKKGVYNYIREDYDPYTQESIPRKYFSGGIEWKINEDLQVTNVREKKTFTRLFQGVVAGVVMLASVALRSPAYAQDNTISPLPQPPAPGLLENEEKPIEKEAPNQGVVIKNLDSIAKEGPLDEKDFKDGFDLRDALNAIYQSDEADEFKQKVVSAKIFSRLFNVYYENLMDEKKADRLKVRAVHLAEIVGTILRHQQNEIEEEILENDIIGKIRNIYHAEVVNRKLLFELARTGPSSHEEGSSLKQPNRSYFNWVWQEKIQEHIDEGRFPNIQQKFGPQVPSLRDQMRFYNGGAFELTKAVVKLGQSKNQRVIKEIKKAGLIKSLFHYATLPSPVNGYVSATTETMLGLAEIIEAQPGFFLEELNEIDEVLGQSIVDFIKDNLGKEHAAPYQRLTDSKASPSYEKAFRKIKEATTDATSFIDEADFSIKVSQEVLETLRKTSSGQDENGYFLFVNKGTGVIEKVTNRYVHSNRTNFYVNEGFLHYANELAKKHGYLLIGDFHAHPDTFINLKEMPEEGFKDDGRAYDLLSRGDSVSGQVRTKQLNFLGVGFDGNFEVLVYLPLFEKTLGVGHAYLKRKDEFLDKGVFPARSRVIKNRSQELVRLKLKVVDSTVPSDLDILDQYPPFIKQSKKELNSQEYGDLIYNLKKIGLANMTITSAGLKIKGLEARLQALRDRLQTEDVKKEIENLQEEIQKLRKVSYEKDHDHFDFVGEKDPGVIIFVERQDGIFVISGSVNDIDDFQLWYKEHDGSIATLLFRVGTNLYTAHEKDATEVARFLQSWIKMHKAGIGEGILQKVSAIENLPRQVGALLRENQVEELDNFVSEEYLKFINTNQTLLEEFTRGVLDRGVSIETWELLQKKGGPWGKIANSVLKKLGGEAEILKKTKQIIDDGIKEKRTPQELRQKLTELIKYSSIYRDMISGGVTRLIEKRKVENDFALRLFVVYVAKYTYVYLLDQLGLRGEEFDNFLEEFLDSTTPYYEDKLIWDGTIDYKEGHIKPNLNAKIRGIEWIFDIVIHEAIHKIVAADWMREYLRLNFGDDMRWLLATALGRFNAGIMEGTFLEAGFQPPFGKETFVDRQRTPFLTHAKFRLIPDTIRTWDEVVKYIEENKGGKTWGDEPGKSYIEGDLLAVYSAYHYGKGGGLLIRLYGTRFKELNFAQMELAAAVLRNILKGHEVEGSFFDLEEKIIVEVRKLDLRDDTTYETLEEKEKGLTESLIKELKEAGQIKEVKKTSQNIRDREETKKDQAILTDGLNAQGIAQLDYGAIVSAIKKAEEQHVSPLDLARELFQKNNISLDEQNQLTLYTFLVVLDALRRIGIVYENLQPPTLVGMMRVLLPHLKSLDPQNKDPLGTIRKIEEGINDRNSKIFQEFIEHILDVKDLISPTTGRSRYPDQTFFLQEFALPRLIAFKKMRNDRVIRIGSLGSSTGEDLMKLAETVSIVFHQTGENLNDWKIILEARDVSAKSLNVFRETAQAELTHPVFQIETKVTILGDKEDLKEISNLSYDILAVRAVGEYLRPQIRTQLGDALHSTLLLSDRHIIPNNESYLSFAEVGPFQNVHQSRKGDFPLIQLKPQEQEKIKEYQIKKMIPLIQLELKEAIPRIFAEEGQIRELIETLAQETKESSDTIFKFIMDSARHVDLEDEERIKALLFDETKAEETGTFAEFKERVMKGWDKRKKSPQGEEGIKKDEAILTSLEKLEQDFLDGTLLQEGIARINQEHPELNIRKSSDISKLNSKVANFDIAFLPLLTKIPQAVLTDQDWGIYRLTKEGIELRSGDGIQKELIPFTKEAQALIAKLLEKYEEVYFDQRINATTKSYVVHPFYYDQGDMSIAISLIRRGIDLVSQTIDIDHEEHRRVLFTDEEWDMNIHQDRPMPVQFTLIILGLLERLPAILRPGVTREDWYWVPRESGIEFVNKVTGEHEWVNFTPDETVLNLPETQKIRHIFEILRLLPSHHAMNDLDQKLLKNEQGLLTMYDQLRLAIQRNFDDHVPLAYDQYEILAGLKNRGKVLEQEAINSRFTLRELQLIYAMLSSLPREIVDQYQDQFFSFRPRELRNFTQSYPEDGHASLVIAPLNMREVWMFWDIIRSKEIRGYLGQFTKEKIIELSFIRMLLHELAHRVYKNLDTKLQRAYGGISWDMKSWTGQEATKKRNQGRRFLGKHFLIDYAFPEEDNSQEDFVDQFSAYILFGPQFRRAAERSAAIKAKYNFFKNIFKGNEYERNFDYHAKVPQIDQAMITQDELKQKQAKVDQMLEQVRALREGPHTSLNLKKTAEDFEKVYPRLLEFSDHLIQRYQEIANRYRLNPGEIRLYMVGGRVRGTPLKEDSDIDLIFAVENPGSSLGRIPFERFSDPLEAWDFKLDRMKELLADVSKISNQLGVRNLFHILSLDVKIPEDDLIVTQERLLLAKSKGQTTAFPATTTTPQRDEAMVTPDRQPQQILMERMGFASAMLELKLNIHGLEMENLFQHYEKEHDAYILDDKVMDVMGQLGGMKNGEALNLVGFVFIRGSTVEKLKTADKEAFLSLRHEQRHNDYHAIHGYAIESSEQKLIDELYAYFASFIQIYGVEGLTTIQERQIGTGPWAQIVLNVLIQDYLKDEREEALKADLIERLRYVASILDWYLKTQDPNMILEFLKTATSLNQILAMVNFDYLKDNLKEKIPLEEYERLAGQFRKFRSDFQTMKSKEGGRASQFEANPQRDQAMVTKPGEPLIPPLWEGQIRYVPEAMVKKGGWKLHLRVQPHGRFAEIIHKWLWRNTKKGEVGYKYLHGGDKGEKDFTIYVGPKKDADQLAIKISQEIGYLLRNPGEHILETDIEFAPKVWGRFDVKDIEGNQYFYGMVRAGVEGTGIPILKKDWHERFRLLFNYGKPRSPQQEKADHKKLRQSEPLFIQRAFDLLKNELGDYFTGGAENVEGLSPKGERPLEQEGKSKDEAMITKPVGGIDFAPGNLILDIKRDANGAPLPLPVQQMQQIKIDGLVPVIIQITPVTNFPLLFGLSEQGTEEQLSLKD